MDRGRPLDRDRPGVLGLRVDRLRHARAAPASRPGRRPRRRRPPQRRRRRAPARARPPRPCCPGPASRRSRSATRTTPSSSCSASSTCRRWQPRASRVQLNQNIGPTEVTMQALKTGVAGDVSRVPERLQHARSPATATAFRTRLRRLPGRAALRARARAELLAPTPFSDTDAIAVTVALRAQNNQLRSIGDLRRVAEHADDRRAAAVRQQGRPACRDLEQAYGFTPRTRSSRWRSARSTRRSTTARSRPPTSTPPTASWPAATTGCSPTPATCSAGATWCRSSRRQALTPRGRRSRPRSTRQPRC